MSGIELVEVARLATTYGDGTVRLGSDQNFTLSGVPEGDVDRLLDEELLQKYSPFPGPFERGVVACTGSEFCRFAVVETKERAVTWARWLDSQLSTTAPSDANGARGRRDDAGVIRMHFSGCPASCAQPQIADVGFRGDTAHAGITWSKPSTSVWAVPWVRMPPSSTGSRTPGPSTRCRRPFCGS
jgi:ferredoxin-nitrite reductase